MPYKILTVQQTFTGPIKICVRTRVTTSMPSHLLETRKLLALLEYNAIHEIPLSHRACHIKYSIKETVYLRRSIGPNDKTRFTIPLHYVVVDYSLFSPISLDRLYNSTNHPRNAILYPICAPRVYTGQRFGLNGDSRDTCTQQ